MGASESTGRLNGTETTEERRRRESRRDSSGAAAIAIATAGAAVAAWGISRMLSDTEEKDEARMIRTHDQGANTNRHGDQTLYFGSGSARSGLYAQAPEAIMSEEKSKIWSPPPPNRYKMNTDGGFRSADLRVVDRGRPSPYAGILRNHLGDVIITFRGLSGQNDCLEAEIFGILQGLELLDKLGLKGAILENDSEQAVLWIKEEKSHGIPREKMAHCNEIINKCRTLYRENKIDIHHIHRDANKCADKLCRIALKEGKQYVETDQADLPDEVKMLVDEDKSAYYDYRSSLK